MAQEQVFLLYEPGKARRSRVHQVMSVLHLVIEDEDATGLPDVPADRPWFKWVEVPNHDVDRLHDLMAERRLYWDQARDRWRQGRAWEHDVSS